VAENDVVPGAPWSRESLTAGAIIWIWISPGDSLVVPAGDVFVAGDCVLVAGGVVVVNEGSGLGGGSPQAGAAATHNVAKATAFAITSAITAAFRERTRDRAPLMPSPLAVTILAILVRSEQSDASSPVLRFATFFLVSSVTISSGSRATHQRRDHQRLREIRSATAQLVQNTVTSTVGLTGKSVPAGLPG
jgi:hypothetical protein